MSESPENLTDAGESNQCLQIIFEYLPLPCYCLSKLLRSTWQSSQVDTFTGVSLETPLVFPNDSLNTHQTPYHITNHLSIAQTMPIVFCLICELLARDVKANFCTEEEIIRPESVIVYTIDSSNRTKLNFKIDDGST